MGRALGPCGVAIALLSLSMALSLTLAGRGLALVPPGATPSASSAWVFLVIPDPIGAVCLTVVGHDLAWKVLYLVGITGKAVEQVVPKAVGDKDGLVLEAKEECTNEARARRG